MLKGTCVLLAPIALLPLLLVAPARAQQSGPAAAFDRTEVMIPMRDGVSLHTVVYAPRGEHAPLPIIFHRTPYGIGGFANSFGPGAANRELADDGYIFTFQDIRGRYGSGGQFVMQRPACTDAALAARTCIDEGSDAYDTIDWLTKNVAGNNGRVGMLGVSYDGWLTAMALIRPHPALRAASPQASPADMWLGDDFHHQGAFRLSYGFEYAAMMETSKENEQFSFDRYDTYQWYLVLGPLSNVNAKYLHGKIPTWNDYVAHPDYDAFWQRQTLIPSLRSVTVPTLNVAGWWDQEDFYGPITIYRRLEQFDTAHKNFLVVGPWRHGGWSGGPGQKLGDIDFGSATAQYYREKIQAPFFAYYLKDRGDLRQPEAITFQAGDNTWKTWDSWPPRTGVTSRDVYLTPGGALSWDKPQRTQTQTQAQAATGTRTGGVAYSEYVSDPAHPVPYRHRPIQPTYDPRGSGWYTWLLEDQRFVDDRADVLGFVTQPLTEDVTIAGDIAAHLVVATSGTDSDWIVKLIDVYPETGMPEAKLNGWQLMVANDAFRGRYREGWQKPVPFVPDQPTKVNIDLHTQDYTFRAGHRIMVQVQSTWFPVIDRNPQTFVPNIFQAKAGDYRSARQRVYGASHLTLPVVTPAAKAAP